jgi:hypothetical protein
MTAILERRESESLWGRFCTEISDFTFTSPSLLQLSIRSFSFVLEFLFLSVPGLN